VNKAFEANMKYLVLPERRELIKFYLCPSNSGHNIPLKSTQYEWRKYIWAAA
jgi:hypothetical protein